MAFTPGMRWGQLRDWILGAHYTQSFGPSSLSLEPAYGGYAHFHKGVDLAFDGGTKAPIRAPASGKVAYAGWYNGFGNTVMIDAPNGFRYILGHMSGLWTGEINPGEGPYYQSPLTTTGQNVYAGDIIGFQGSTGASTGNHLHLEVHDRNGAPVNLGSNVKAVFGSIYHTLGMGSGYMPGQWTSATAPPPDRAVNAPVPSPFPPFTGDVAAGAIPQTGAATEPGAGQPGGGVLGGLFGNPLAALTDPTSLFAGWVPFLREGVGPTIFILLVGGVLLIVGLGKLGNEKPVAVVVQPIEGAAKGAVKAATNAAAVAA